MNKLDHKFVDVWLVKDNNEMLATLMEVIDSDPEIMCSLSFTRCEEALAALQVDC